MMVPDKKEMTVKERLDNHSKSIAQLQTAIWNLTEALKKVADEIQEMICED